MIFQVSQMQNPQPLDSNKRASEFDSVSKHV